MGLVGGDDSNGDENSRGMEGTAAEGAEAGAIATKESTATASKMIVKEKAEAKEGGGDPVLRWLPKGPMARQAHAEAKAAGLTMDLGTFFAWRAERSEAENRNLNWDKVKDPQPGDKERSLNLASCKYPEYVAIQGKRKDNPAYYRILQFSSSACHFFFFSPAVNAPNVIVSFLFGSDPTALHTPR